MNSNIQSFRMRSNLRAGFTLVEMLVVMLIMSILLTLGSVAVSGSGGKGTTTARATAEALFDQARLIAIGKGTRSRVLIDVKPNKPSYLRRMVVVYEDPDTPESWILASQGYTFPEGVYYSTKFSKKDHNSSTGDLETWNLNSPSISVMYQSDYKYYEFNSEGICTTGVSGDNYHAPSFVIGAGRLAGNNTGEPTTVSSGARDFAGFVVWRNGATSIFRNPDQILNGESGTKIDF